MAAQVRDYNVAVRFPLQSRIPRRQAGLLLIAIMVPCLVLVLLGWQVIDVERQLEPKRLVDARDLRLARVRRELLSLLEEISINEWGRLWGGESTRDLPDNVIAFVGAVVQDRLQLPWEDRPAAQMFRERLTDADFADAIRKGEVEELETHRYANAVVHYQEAVKAARHELQQGYAQLLLARSLEKANRRREGLVAYEGVLALPLDLVDEHGIPLALYAAPPLIKGATGRKEILECIHRVAERERRLPTHALYMTRDLARKLEAPAIEKPVVRAIDEHEWAEEFQRDLAKAGRESWGERTSWTPSGKAPFLVHVKTMALSSSQGSAKRGMVLAVHTDQVLARMTTVQPVRVAGPADSEGEVLGEGFPGLRLVLPPLELQGSRLRQILLAFAVVLALSFALLAGYLVQRDVRRSLRLAELRSQFVSSVTHELKTPLTAIRMFTETLRLDEEVDRQTHGEYLDTILHESERLSRLVDNVLDFGNIERGKKTYRFRPVRLEEVVEGAVRTIQYPLEQAGFTLDVEVNRDLPPVAADSDALEQAVLNLLTNAIKYSGDSRQIHLHLDRKDGHARIQVTDHGVGIALVEQGRIFERFYRVTSAENQHVPGAGLGLTLATHIVKAHGGGLDVESSVDGGSTFTIRLPLPETEPA